MDITLTDYIAGYAAFLSTVTSGWALYREFGDRARLQLDVAVMQMSPADDPEDRHDVLRGSITNIGSKTAYVANLCFEMADESRSAFFAKEGNPTYIVPHFPHELQPSQIVGFVMPLRVLKRKDTTVTGVLCIDTHGKEWRASKKMWERVLKEAAPKLNPSV